jgi:non-specific protein-tyrosine kinase
MEGVVDTLKLDQSWQNLKKVVNAQLVEGTQIIHIFVESSSPEQAQLIADETAMQMILYNPNELQNKESEGTQSFVRQQLESLQTRLEAGQGRLTSLERKMAITTSTDRLIELQNEVEALESLITDWENNYTQLLFFLESKQSPTTLTIIEPAQANSIPVRPRIRLYMLIAGGVGLFLALGLIFLLEYLDDSIKSIDEFQQGFGTLILGTIPKIKGLDYENKLAVFQDHMSSTSEVFRLIGGNLQLYAAENAQKTIMITSPNQSEGKSLIIASLGTVLAQSGLDTIIVDANLRRPVVHEIFKIENKKGLMDLLSIEKFNIDDYLQDTQLDNLKLLTIGLSELNPSGLLKQQKVNQIIYALKKQADVVLFDSSSALDHADSRFLSTQMDGVILVAASNRTKNDQVKRSIQNLELSNANISGVIFNNYLPGKITRLFTKIRTFIRDREYRKRTDQDVGFVNKKDNFPKNQSEAPQESVPS